MPRIISSVMFSCYQFQSHAVNYVHIMTYRSRRKRVLRQGGDDKTPQRDSVQIHVITGCSH